MRWLRNLFCYHKIIKSTHISTLGMKYCEWCGCVWHRDGTYFGRYKNNPDIKGEPQ